jgi:uncharacterized protein YegL
MPRLTGDDLQQHDLGGHYGYSAERLDDLGATEYTLVAIVQDESPSVSAFKAEMEKSLREVIKACKFSPRADNLMLRLVTFANDMEEFHGFKLLENCNLDDYNDCLNCHGVTALYEASDSAVKSMGDYAKQLADSDFQVNGIVFIITDGLDNASNLSTPKTVRKSLEKLVHDEALESIVTVLIGVNVDNPQVIDFLETFKDEAGLSQFVAIKEANAKTLAKLAEFVSKSISAQSQSLGTGGPSQPVSLSI